MALPDVEITLTGVGAHLARCGKGMCSAALAHADAISQVPQVWPVCEPRSFSSVTVRSAKIYFSPSATAEDVSVLYLRRPNQVTHAVLSLRLDCAHTALTLHSHCTDSRLWCELCCGLCS